MFPFLGTAATTSIRLSAVQGFSPLHSSLAFVLRIDPHHDADELARVESNQFASALPEA